MHARMRRIFTVLVLSALVACASSSPSTPGPVVRPSSAPPQLASRVDAVGDSQCNALYRCESGMCVSDAGARCDASTLVAAGGQRQNCAPYACAAEKCATTCSSKSTCAFPADCTDDRRCVDFTAPTGSDSGCATSRGAAGSDSSRGSSLLLALLTPFVRRRRSSDNRRIAIGGRTRRPTRWLAYNARARWTY